MNEDDGTEKGDCLFIVHGLTGKTLEHLGKIRPYEITARAVEHFKSDGNVLDIGQSKESESLYNNPKLYPQMFSWLCPYGLDGVRDTYRSMSVSEEKHKMQLLIYNDKQFQLEALFPLVALNNEQIKNSTTVRYLLADKNKFNDIVERLMSVNESVLGNLIECIKKGSVEPETDEEKKCFCLLSDLNACYDCCRAKRRNRE